jgi:APA family basic amino acid/polyamine antiporter
VITSAKLIILFFIIAISFTLFDKQNFTPFLDQDHGPMGVVEATLILFFGYLGFDFITTIAEEAKNPSRDIPIAIQLSVILSMGIYALVALAVQGVGRMGMEGQGDGETALAEIFVNRKYFWMSDIIFVCAILGITAAAFTNLMSQTRILYTFAKDGLFFKIFAEIDPEKNVPIKGSWIQLIPIAMSAFFLNLTTLAKVCSLCNLMTYAFINLGVVVLRLHGIVNKQSLKRDIQMEKHGVGDAMRLRVHTHLQSHFENSLVRVMPWAFMVFAFLSAMSLTHGWNRES